MNDNVWGWWYDEFVRQWITLYYWPYWVVGNADNLMSAGVTLNGIRSICKP